MVTGWLAAIVYGHPRLTLGVDLVIRLPTKSASTFTALRPAEEFCVPPVEVVAKETTLRRDRMKQCFSAVAAGANAMNGAPATILLLL